MPPTSDQRDLKALLDPFAACRLECDGLTRVLHTVLAAQRIAHRVMVGRITRVETRQAMELHFWISLTGADWLVDYRARMWLGDCTQVPHGVFGARDFPAVKYSGRAVPMRPLEPGLFEFLTGGVPLPQSTAAVYESHLLNS